MKVFQITEVDWWAGEDAESIRAAYRLQVGEEADTFFEEFGPAIEIPDDQLDKMTITDVDEVGHPKHTFREALNEIIASGKTEPCFVATTEY